MVTGRTDLIKKFNDATADIKKKEDKPVLKVCTKCGKATTDWIQTTTYDCGKLVESQTYIICDACREKRDKTSKK